MSALWNSRWKRIRQMPSEEMESFILNYEIDNSDSEQIFKIYVFWLLAYFTGNDSMDSSN